MNENEFIDSILALENQSKILSEAAEIIAEKKSILEAAKNEASEIIERGRKEALLFKDQTMSIKQQRDFADIREDIYSLEDEDKELMFVNLRYYFLYNLLRFGENKVYPESCDTVEICRSNFANDLLDHKIIQKYQNLIQKKLNCSSYCVRIEKGEYPLKAIMFLTGFFKKNYRIIE